MELNEIYKQLTNVDIDEQRKIWDERGKGYYGEFLVFCELYKSINGFGKILMNLNIPVGNSKSTEIDLLLIHETGLYIFEIKHHKGTIYGKDTDSVWTQYFRTASNNTFKNPIEQNGYHIRALKNMFPNLPIHSIIVFTNYDCVLKVINTNPEIDICSLQNIIPALNNRFQHSNNILSCQEIDVLFDQLAIYSQMQKTVAINAQEASFFSWLQPTITELENKKAEVEQIKNNWIINNENLKKTKTKYLLIAISFALICAVVSAIVVLGFKQKYEEDFSSFEQKFLHIDEIENEYIDALNDYVQISNVQLSPLANDAVSFTARITMNNDTYGILLTETSKYIVMTTSGKVYEYDVFGEHLSYYSFNNRIGKGYRSYGDLSTIQFWGISNINDISYVKITGIELFKLDISRTAIKTDLEIELYSK